MRRRQLSRASCFTHILSSLAEVGAGRKSNDASPEQVSWCVVHGTVIGMASIVPHEMHMEHICSHRLPRTEQEFSIRLL